MQGNGSGTCLSAKARPTVFEARPTRLEEGPGDLGKRDALGKGADKRAEGRVRPRGKTHIQQDGGGGGSRAGDDDGSGDGDTGGSGEGGDCIVFVMGVVTVGIVLVVWRNNGDIDGGGCNGVVLGIAMVGILVLTVVIIR